MHPGTRTREFLTIQILRFMRQETFGNRCERKSQYENVKMNKYINMTKYGH